MTNELDMELKHGFQVKTEKADFTGALRWKTEEKFIAGVKKEIRTLQQQVKVERQYNNGKIEAFHVWQDVPEEKVD